MTNKKKYKFGRHTCSTYMKPAGRGYEVGFYFGGKKPVFVGNFIHKSEARDYYTHLNKEWKSFANKYWAGPKTSVTWYTKFFTNHIYNHYYKHLDRKFTSYERQYASKTRKFETEYKRKAKAWDKSERYTVSAKAA